MRERRSVRQFQRGSAAETSDYDDDHSSALRADQGSSFTTGSNRTRGRCWWSKGCSEEVAKAGMRMGLTADHISMKGIGYKEILAYLDGRCSLEDSHRQCEKKHATLREKTVNVVPEIW